MPDPDFSLSSSSEFFVGSGKFGLPDFAEGYDGHKVRFLGTLIYRERMTMVEINDDVPILRVTSLELIDGKDTP